jgi:3-deoxy-D-manno-octulosonate 8-phosphate phosphatase (KDO 8-P phosphatase)
VDNLFRDKARKIQMLLLDVDGVLTDGTFERHGDEEVKRFHSRDGIGLVLARKAGLKLGLISGRESKAVAHRATELNFDFVRLGAGDKLAALQLALEQEGLSEDQVAFMGDDLPDLPVLSRVGLSAAVADAHAEVRGRVHYVTRARGGFGAVRELVDQILAAKGLLENLVKEYLVHREGDHGSET